MPPSDGRPLRRGGGMSQYGPFDEDVPDKRKTNRDPSSDMKRMPTDQRHERSAQAYGTGQMMLAATLVVDHLAGLRIGVAEDIGFCNREFPVALAFLCPRRCC